MRLSALPFTRLFISTVLVCLSAAPGACSEWVELFNGKDLQGWKASENRQTFSVKDGAIVAHGPRSHLFYDGPELKEGFKNFELLAEVNASRGANSGIYFHSEFQNEGWPNKGFEVQINNSATEHDGYKELKKTGSLYGVRNIYKQLVEDDTWFTLHVMVRDKNVQIRLNDLLLVDYYEAQGDPGTERQLGRGTFALQGHDPESRVAFRKVKVRRLPDDLSHRRDIKADAFYREVMQLGSANFPLADLHMHLKGGLTMDELLQHGRKVGFGYGVAVNCGLGFSITNDMGIYSFLREHRSAPVYLGMQAEGREWVKLFSPAAISKFDYVFTDAMTITDHRGKRTRLWIKEEVEIPDHEAFMERLVSAIEEIVEKEPVDVYVNPTFLPDVIAGKYEQLWTADRRGRVISACARNGVAIEINSRYEIPKAQFIKEAKKAGIKFTLGTNNPGREIVENHYGLAMVRECGLSWQDMWLPGPGSNRRVERMTK